MSQIKPLSSSGPAWRLTERAGIPGQIEYMLWAPRSLEYHEAHKHRETGYSETHPTREHWQAEWVGNDGLEGDGRRAMSLDEVLVIFPEWVAQMFRQAVAEARLTL